MLKAIRNFFQPLAPLATLVATMPALRRLKNNLLEVKKSNGKNPLDWIINFFNIVSPWHDRGLTEIVRSLEEAGPLYTGFLEQVRLLQAHFVTAGRQQFGWNRTERGQMVGPQDVFLGNRRGLNTKSVSFWKGEKNNGNDAYEIVCVQARDFMSGHVTGMIEAIDRLEEMLATADARAIRAGRFTTTQAAAA